MTAIAAVLSALIAFFAFRARALTADGAVLAFLVGFLVLAGTGWPGGLALGAFFVSSTFLSRRAEKHEPAWLDAPGNRRNAWQVLANGGVAALGGLIGLLGRPATGLAIVACSLAAAAADTWATSSGMASAGDPVDVLRWKRVPKGTSGGVSLRGTLGGVGGAIVVATAPLMAGAPASLLLAGAVTGTIGMVADSLIGATLQGRFICPACELQSERPIHRCGNRTVPTGGLTGLTNDGVNFLATAVAGLIGSIWSYVCGSLS
jgi:uncharacterized protein (TIGR00297 family)